MLTALLTSRCLRARSGGFAFALLGLLAAGGPAQAQAPLLTLGIYGGVPTPSTTAVPYVAAKITLLTPTSNTVTGSLSLTLPLNGLRNYSFYYAPLPGTSPTPGTNSSGGGSASGGGFLNHSSAEDPDSTDAPLVTIGASTFLHAGTYRVDYLDANGKSKLVTTVTYAPNAGHTNGVQVPGNPPNVAPGTTIAGYLGIQGKVTSSVGPMAGRPVQGVTVQLFSSTGQQLATVPTNGNGFYSFYYTYGSVAKFIPPGKYLVRTTLYGITQQDTVSYQPNTDPTSPNYYVLGARAVADFSFAQP